MEDQPLRRIAYASILFITVSGVVSAGALAADVPKALLGSWTGRATGPDGGPPSGDIEVTFARDAAKDVTGKIVVKAAGGVQYSGQVSNIMVRKKILTATATFKLGESPTEINVTGPFNAKTIAGTFVVLAKGEKIGEGTFSITKGPAAAPQTK
jgi:hypothetical protein